MRARPLRHSPLFRLSEAAGFPSPRTTAQALANLTRNPWQNVDAIYALTTLSNAYEPALERMPDAWTVTVKVNDTGDDSHLFAGLGNLTFDSRGYAWITNNTNQGTPFSGQFMVVLKPNGRPSDGTNGTESRLLQAADFWVAATGSASIHRAQSG